METQQANNNIPSATVPAQESIFSDMVDVTRYEKNVKNARIWLYVIAAIQTVMGIVEYNTIDDKELALTAGLIDMAVAFLFFVLGLWSLKQPFAAFTTALVVYVVINLGLMILNPTNISGFLILKIFVIIALVKAINSAREIQKLKDSFDS